MTTPAHLMLQEVWSKGDLALIDELTTEDYVEHDPVLPEPVRGREALKETIAMFREGTPDLTKAVDETYVDGDTVVVTYTATGTHEGEFMGIARTGREIEVDGVFVYRVEDDRLAEGRDVWDAFGLLGQIGALPNESDEPRAVAVDDTTADRL
ncbi:MAG: ester cyclase [Halobacteriota archaeon]